MTVVVKIGVSPEGNPHEHYNLGISYQERIETKKDECEACEWSMKCAERERSTTENNGEVKTERRFERVMKRIEDDENKDVKNDEQSDAAATQNMDEDEKGVEKGKEIREVVSIGGKEVQHVNNKEFGDLPESNSKRLIFIVRRLF
ncbi:16301_t:CDS:2, partial [Racocetra persica]